MNQLAQLPTSHQRILFICHPMWMHLLISRALLAGAPAWVTDRSRSPISVGVRARAFLAADFYVVPQPAFVLLVSSRSASSQVWERNVDAIVVSNLCPALAFSDDAISFSTMALLPGRCCAVVRWKSGVLSSHSAVLGRSLLRVFVVAVCGLWCVCVVNVMDTVPSTSDGCGSFNLWYGCASFHEWYGCGCFDE